MLTLDSNPLLLDDRLLALGGRLLGIDAGLLGLDERLQTVESFPHVPGIGLLSDPRGRRRR